MKKKKFRLKKGDDVSWCNPETGYGSRSWAVRVHRNKTVTVFMPDDYPCTGPRPPLLDIPVEWVEDVIRR